MPRSPFVSFALAVFVARLGAAEINLPEWRYSETSAEGAATGETVTVPHTWNATDIQAGNGKDHSSNDGYRRAPSWYAITLPAADLPAGKRVFARFAGVSSVADVSLNGSLLGEHRGPGTAFAFELTQGLKRDGGDTLVVKADNTWRADVAPISGDFGIPGGMYRPAHLLVKDTVCFSPLALGDFGAQVRQILATKDTGEIGVSAHLDNAGAPVATTIVFRLKDAAGKTVAEKSVEKTVASGASDVGRTLAVTNPTLWNGVKNPYLYTLELSLKSGDGSIDTVTLPIGFRSYGMDPKRGFLLNGESYPLHGVNRHQDREKQAWAVSADQEREDAAIIAEMGANTVRCAHYPHSQVFLDACDKLGLLVWAEAPLIDTVGKEPEKLGANVESQLREIIRQQGHHPSVFVWSIYNEIALHQDIRSGSGAQAAQRAGARGRLHAPDRRRGGPAEQGVQHHHRRDGIQHLPRLVLRRQW